MQTFSLCMIVKNEEKNLERCLSSVGDLMDEIIIVDTGSTDRTKEIAHQYTDHVFNFAWIDDFSAARNFSFAKATMDYIIWLDGDDVLLPKDRESFKKLKETLDPSFGECYFVGSRRYSQQRKRSYRKFIKEESLDL